MCPCIQRCTLSVSVFTRQIRSSDCSLSLFANRIVTLSHSSANIEQPPPPDLFKDFNNITGGRMYSMFLCLPPSCLPNTNTIASVAAVKTRVPHSAGEIFFWWGPNSLSGSQRLFVCLLMQSGWCVFKSACDTLLWLPVLRAVFPLFIFQHSDRNHTMAKRDSHPFLSCLLPTSYRCRITKFPLKTTFIFSLRKPNIKSLEAETNPTWSYRQDFGFTKDCLSSFSLSLGRTVTKILRLRWMFFWNISRYRSKICNIMTDRWGTVYPTWIIQWLVPCSM